MESSAAITLENLSKAYDLPSRTNAQAQVVAAVAFASLGRRKLTSLSTLTSMR